MSEQTTHPSSEELSAFSLGQLPPDAAVAVESHISECQPCCDTLLGLSSDDTFVGLLQEAEQLPPDQTVDHSLSDPQSSSSQDVPSPLAEHPRYEVLRLIGKGGMGDVFEARHRRMERIVALKVINRGLVQKPEAVDRFHREVKAAAQLSHPNIVTAYDADQADDFHFMVMEYVDGVDLSQTVKDRGALPVAEACDYIRHAAIGLQHAHERRMVHRDIKPHNLMVTKDGTVKILDFGLASLAPEAIADADTVEARGDLTAAGAIMGTPDFISPEQADDARTADIRSDIYSLGATLYYLLSGRVPFAEGSLTQKLKSHAHAEPEPLESQRDDIPPELVAVVTKMTAKNPGDRFQTPAEVAEALKSFSRSVEPRKGVEPPTQAKPRGWKPTFLSLTAIAALFVAALFAGLIYYVQTDYGVVRVEVTDPSLEVTIKDHTITMKDGDGKPLTIRPGEQTLIVRRDDADFEFETESFQIRRGEKIAFKVEMLPGEIVVTKDNKSFAHASVLVGEWLAEGPGDDKFRLTFNPDGTFGMVHFGSVDLIEFSATGTYDADFSVSPAHLDLDATFHNTPSAGIVAKDDPPPQDEDDATAAVGPGHGEFGDADLAAPAPKTHKLESGPEKHKIELIIKLVDANSILISDLEADNRPNTFGGRTMVLHRQGVEGVDRSDPVGGADGIVGSVSGSKLELSADLAKNFIRSRVHRDNFEEELCKAISYAAGIPNEQWEQFASTSNASIDAIQGTPLTWFIVKQQSLAGGTRMLTDKPAPMRDVHRAMSPSQSLGYVSLIQPEYITKLKLDIERDTTEFKGTVWYEVPELYAGKFDFTMIYHVGKIKVKTVELPQIGVRLVRDNDIWEKRTTSNQSAAHKAASVNNLRQIAMAFMMFEEEHGYLPSVTTKLPGTKHPVSWRVAILKYLDEGLYNEYKLDEPWYSDHNKKLLEKLPSFYRHPSQAKDDTNTGYMTLVGETTATGNGETPITDSDGARTILVTEATTNIPWTKPEDHLVDDKAFLPGRRPDRNGWNVVFVDGSSHFISADTSPEVLKALVTRDSLDQIEIKNGEWKKVGETSNDKVDDKSATEATLKKPHSLAFRLVSQIPTEGKSDLQEVRRQLLARSRTEGGAAPAENVLENQARVRLSDDAHTVLVESGAIQQMWDVSTGKLKEFSEWGGSGGQMGFVPDSSLAYFASGGVGLWDLKTHARHGKLIPHADGPAEAWTESFSPALHPDGTLIATRSAENKLRLWHVNSQQPASEEFSCEGSVSQLSFSSDGRWLFSKCQDEWTVRSVAKPESVIGRFPDNVSLTAVYSAESQLLATFKNNSSENASKCEITVRKLGGTDPVEVRRVTVDAHIGRHCAWLDGNHLLVCGESHGRTGPSTLFLISMESEHPIVRKETLSRDGRVAQIVVAADHRHYLVSTYRSTTCWKLGQEEHVWQVGTSEAGRRHQLHIGDGDWILLLEKGQTTVERPAIVRSLKNGNELWRKEDVIAASATGKAFCVVDAKGIEVWKLSMQQNRPDEISQNSADPMSIIRKAVLPQDFDAEGAGWERFRVASVGARGGTVSGFPENLRPVLAKLPQPKLSLQKLADEVEAEIKQHPQWKAGVAVLGFLEAELGNHERAVKLFEQVLAEKEPPITPEAAWIFGLALEGKGPKLDQIVITLYEINVEGERMPANSLRVSAIGSLSRLYARYGRRDEAKQLLQRLTEPEGPYVVCSWARGAFYKNRCTECHQQERGLENYILMANALTDIGAPVEARMSLARIGVSFKNAYDSDEVWTKTNTIVPDWEYQGKEAFQPAKVKAESSITPQLILKALESGVFNEPNPLKTASREPASDIDLILGVRGENGKSILFSPVIDMLALAAQAKGADAAIANNRIDRMLAEAFQRNFSRNDPDQLEVGIAATIFAFLRNDLDAAEQRIKILNRPMPDEEVRKAAVGFWLVAREALKHERTRKIGEQLTECALEAAEQQDDPLWARAIREELLEHDQERKTDASINETPAGSRE